MKRKLYGILAVVIVFGAVTISLLFNLGSPETVSENRVGSRENNLTEPLSAGNAKSFDAAPQTRDFEIRQLPLSFEMNQGQAAEEFDFISRNVGRALYLAPGKAVIAFPKTANRKRAKTTENALSPNFESELLQIELLDARSGAEPQGLNRLAAKSNYLLGNESHEWETTVAQYSKAQFSEIYPGIDVVYYGNQEKLEYDFIVKPGARPDSIRLKFDGAKSLQIDETGNLIARLDSSEVKQNAPVVYQEINGAKKRIAGEFVLRSSREVGFQIGDYDKTQNLVIDPVLVYSTYLGGDGGGLFSSEGGNTITLDQNGNVYLTGSTPSGNFPTRNPYQANSGGGLDCFITKLNQNGTDLIFSTYLGGSDTDICLGLAVDGAGNIYVAGQTLSTNFPVANPFQNTNGGVTDGFLTKLNPTGNSLIFSTYLGGSGGEVVFDVRVDTSGNIYTGGTTGSGNFPTLNAIQPNTAGGSDCFFTKFNPAGNSLAYSTYFGGELTDSGQGFTADAQGNAYMTGVTNSRNYPVTANVFQRVKSGSDDAFVTKLNPAGSLVYSTYFGGNAIDNAGDIAVDSQANVIITGFTRSLNLPRRNAVQTQLFGGVDSFVSKLSADGRNLIFSTLLGGNILESGFGVAVDNNDNIYATGRTNSGDFPLKKPLQDFGGLDDIYVTKFTPEGALVFSTPLGGDANDVGNKVVADISGNVYVTGIADFGLQTTPGAFQPNPGGGNDAFVAKINTITRTVRSDFDGDKISDIAVFRPSNGTWYILNSSNGAFRGEAFGTNGDRPVPGDYDADGRTDVAVFRPSNSTWYWRNSSNNSLMSITFGSTGDKPVQGDYDADGKTDVAVYRPSIGFWLILQSSDNALRAQQFGVAEDKPVQSDYDGDEQIDLAFFKPSSGVWSILQSFVGFKNQPFGLGSDLPVPSDYDGDGKDDISVFRPEGGIWYISRSRDNSVTGEQFGTNGDVPTPGDYDGDRKTDLSVFRAGFWYIRLSSNNAFRTVQWGTAEDIPIPAAYQPQ